jgi:hypothetical protein
MSLDPKTSARRGLDTMIEMMPGLQVGSPLTWIWVWDIMVHKYKTPEDDYYFKSSLDEIWDDLWANVDKTGFTLEYGTEHLHEHVDDWLVDRGHLVAKEDEE